MTDSHHSTPSAFSSAKLPTLPPAPEVHQARLHGNFNIPLLWGNYTGLDAATEVELEFETEKELSALGQDPSCYLNAEGWNFQYDNRWTHFLFVFQLLSSGFIPFFMFSAFDDTIKGGFFLDLIVVSSAFASLALFMTTKPKYYISFITLIGLVNAGLLAWQQQTLWGFWQGHSFFITGCILYFLAVFGCNLLLALHARFFEHDGSQFNRRTGLVHLAGKRWRKPFVAPFYEFDPVMQVQIMPQGQRDYVLWLYHRYTDRKVCLANRLHSLGLDENNLRAFWDTLQRYMDISQPLPDLPVLEPCRQYDPLAQEHDLHTGRAPRY